MIIKRTKTIKKHIKNILKEFELKFYPHQGDFVAKNQIEEDLNILKLFITKDKYSHNEKKEAIEIITRLSIFIKLTVKEMIQVKSDIYTRYGSIASIYGKNINYINSFKVLAKTEENEHSLSVLCNLVAKENIDFNNLNNSISNILQKNMTITISRMDRILYNSMKDGLIRRSLYKRNGHREIREYIIFKLFNHFNNLTKHDKEIDPSTLTKDEIIQAFNNSITKFIELHYQQPRELKAVLISYENTPLLDYVEITKAMTKDNKELQLLNKIFKEYKQDTKGVIYNYSLFAFLYYAYGLYVSFEHLYNSELLKLLGAYTFKKDRDKPLLKPNHKNLLQHHKDACILSQYDVNIYLENFISFIQQVDAKLKDRYVLSYLVDLSHELTASKEYINRLKNTPYNFSKVSYQDLPQPIKTLLLPINTLQSA